MAMNVDRRREIRVPLELAVEYRGFDDETYHSLTEDLSCHGICVRSEAPFEVGRRCRLLFALPHHQEKTETTGEVRWQSFEPATGRMGIRFSEPIALSVPFPAADEALRRSRQQTEAYFDHLYHTLSDACVWVNSRGEIMRHDDRFLALLGYSDVEVEGRALCDFAHSRDREGLRNLLVPQATGFSSLSTGLFRMQPKEGPALFWKIRVPPEPPWSTSMVVYIQDMTEFRALKDKKHQLGQMLGALKRSVPGRVILLNTDLSIADTHVFEPTPQKESPEVCFNGMDLRKATGLVETKVNERKLWDELQLCAKTGQEFAGDRFHYQGRAGSRPDLFPPGTFRTTISPITDLDLKITSLLMAVKTGDPLSIYGRKEGEDLKYFQQILGAAATGFLIKDVLRDIPDPSTCLVARLDLLRHKLGLERKKSQAGNRHEIAYYAGEIEKIEQIIKDLSKKFEKFKYVAENTYSLEPGETRHIDISECLSRAISIVEICEGFGGEMIRFDPQPRALKIESNEQELITIFLVFLLLSRDCLRTVSDKTIKCETKEGQNQIIASISHNGSVRQDKYLDIIFRNVPVESYFFQSHSISFMDTLLYYGSLLLKKNNIKIKIDNVPGHFSLSLFIPAGSQSELTEKPPKSPALDRGRSS